MEEDVAAIWHRLYALAQEHRERDPTSYTPDATRLVRCSLRIGPLAMDWSLQRVDQTVLRTLYELGKQISLRERLNDQFQGAIVNPTEHRGALHTALRGTPSDAESFDARAKKTHREISQFASEVISGQLRSCCGSAFTDVLHVGIGGSHLGQKFLCDALGSKRLNVHFLSNTQPAQVHRTLNSLIPSTTLVIVASKSFTTPETTQNFQVVKHWFAEWTSNVKALDSNLVLVTSNASRIAGFPGRHFLIPDEVGGRFSVWSAMGLPVLLALGPEQFDELCIGAAAMDQHVATSPMAENAAVILALLTLWNVNFLDATSHGLLAYCGRLRMLPAHLQQLEMESLGKSVRLNGDPVSYHTTGVIWGGEETDGQHAWHQWLHQGTHRYSADFIATADAAEPADQWILANCLAQQHVMFVGHTDTDTPYKSIRGGNGSTLIMLDRIDARSIGMLVALYEHKVTCLAHLWDINAFDQWGVERGKLIAMEVDAALNDPDSRLSNTFLEQRVRKIVERRK